MMECVMKRLVLLIGLFVLSAGSYAQEVRDTVIVAKKWRYEGQWPEGDGVLYSRKHGIYIGKFVEAKPSGPCLCISKDQSEIYYGGIEDGRRHGYGVLSRPGGFYYQGNFENGYYEGSGRLYYPDKSIYVGSFHLGKPLFDDAKVYVFSDKKEFAGKLPVLPEYKLNGKQKAFLKDALKKTPVKKEQPVDSCVRVCPKFNGQEPEAFSKWVNSKLIFPADAFDARQAGTVKVRFTIFENGELGDPVILKSSGVPSFDVEVFKVVCVSPDWTPGMIDGKPRSVTYSFPVMFGWK